ncbi:sarcosine oxidase subunit gamma family protein [Pseudaminobacter arsenicus]|uniref:Sarcosine oxidase subunit gamma family protein n=1 Tax=Borborobacter arsenicus TaxID=1851146 RepID=A0A432V988_9HYPH|nr:sarcosine oxidase subunit gamma family protein [Pseudaminobacter arsenicus]RUM98730.1 sarcosine oxidase subunit gamma family protein [Pseudaminobacter arsenicus]
MVEQESPLKPVWQPGSHGNFAAGIGVYLSESAPGSIVQLAAWAGKEKAVLQAIKAVAGLKLPDGAGGGAPGEARAAFGFAPGKFLVIDEQEGLAERFTQALDIETGTVTDLSHGRTAIRIAGPKAEWVLSKFFAIDFSATAFPIGAGRSTVHHEIFVHIQRSAPTQFELYVFRSFARSFWQALCRASEEVGYEVQ